MNLIPVNKHWHQVWKRKPETNRTMCLQHRQEVISPNFRTALQGRKAGFLVRESPQARKCKCWKLEIVAHTQAVKRRNYGSDSNSIWDNTWSKRKIVWLNCTKGIQSKLQSGVANGNQSKIWGISSVHEGTNECFQPVRSWPRKPRDPKRPSNRKWPVCDRSEEGPPCTMVSHVGRWPAFPLGASPHYIMWFLII